MRKFTEAELRRFDEVLANVRQACRLLRGLAKDAPSEEWRSRLSFLEEALYLWLVPKAGIGGASEELSCMVAVGEGERG